MSRFAMLKNTSKIPGSGSGSGWLPKCNQFFRVHGHIFDKIFVKIHSVVVLKIANRQTDRQTNAGHYITFLEEVIKEMSSGVSQNRMY